MGMWTSDYNSIAATGKPRNINDISLNGNQVTVNLSPVPTLQSKMTSLINSMLKHCIKIKFLK